MVDTCSIMWTILFLWGRMSRRHLKWWTGKKTLWYTLWMLVILMLRVEKIFNCINHGNSPALSPFRFIHREVLKTFLGSQGPADHPQCLWSEEGHPIAASPVFCPADQIPSQQLVSTRLQNQLSNQALYSLRPVSRDRWKITKVPWAFVFLHN